VTGLDHDRTDEDRLELEDEAQIWLLFRRLGNLDRDGQLDSGDQVMSGIVPVAVVAQQDLLATLRDHAKGRFGHAIHRFCGRGSAIEVQPFQRLNRPIFADGPRDTLGQLLSVGLCPVRLAL